MYEKAGGFSSAFLLAFLGDVRYNAGGKGDGGGGVAATEKYTVEKL